MSVHQTSLTSLTILGMTGLLLGCVGQEGSGVDPKTKASELTFPEANALCQILDLRESVHVVECYLQGMVQTSDAAVCEEIAQGCLQREPEPEILNCPLAPIGLQDVTCAEFITAGQIEDCLDDIAAEIDDLAREIRCGAFPELPLPASCEAVDTVCPEIFDLEDE